MLAFAFFAVILHPRNYGWLKNNTKTTTNICH